ncbi:MAG: hypothetical protein SFV19_20950 [Rhodospirillaceae bacterium]|nr:hypothetical protein [Rhodospirillaceae bacterium]
MAGHCNIPIREYSERARDHPIIASVFDYWCGLSDGRAPAKAAFDFMKVYQCAPYLLMAERNEPQRYKFIYCGTWVAENFPLDLTGKTYAADSPRVSRVEWPSFFSEVIDTPCVRFGNAPIDWPSRDFADIDYGVFPLCDTDGKLRYALACLVFNERPWPR